jgi:hypothetical protein
MVRNNNMSGMNFRNAFPQFNQPIKRNSAMDKCIRASKLIDHKKRKKFLDECIKRYNKSLLKLKAKKSKDKSARLNLPKSIKIKEDRQPRVVSTRRRRELINEINRRLDTLRNQPITTDITIGNRKQTKTKKKSNKQRQVDKQEQRLLNDIIEELEEDNKLTARELRNYDKLISVLNDNILDSDDLRARQIILNEFSEFFEELNDSENKLEDIQQIIADMRNMEDDEINEFLYQQELNNLKDEERLTKKNIDKLQDRLMGRLNQPLTTDRDVDDVLSSIDSERAERDSSVSSLIGSDELRFDPVPPSSALTARSA